MSSVPSPSLDDERLTTVGLLFESAGGLRRLFSTQREASGSPTVQSFDILIRLARTPGGELRMSDLATQASSRRPLGSAGPRVEAHLSRGPTWILRRTDSSRPRVDGRFAPRPPGPGRVDPGRALHSRGRGAVSERTATDPRLRPRAQHVIGRRLWCRRRVSGLSYRPRAAARTRVSSRFPSDDSDAGAPTMGSTHSHRVSAAILPGAEGQVEPATACPDIT